MQEVPGSTPGQAPFYTTKNVHGFICVVHRVVEKRKFMHVVLCNTSLAYTIYVAYYLFRYLSLAICDTSPTYSYTPIQVNYVRASTCGISLFNGDNRVRSLNVASDKFKYPIPCGLVARISGFHPGGPGSIPGKGDKRFFAVITNDCHKRAS